MPRWLDSRIGLPGRLAGRSSRAKRRTPLACSVRYVAAGARVEGRAERALLHANFCQQLQEHSQAGASFFLAVFHRLRAAGHKRQQSKNHLPPALRPWTHYALLEQVRCVRRSVLALQLARYMLAAACLFPTSHDE